MLYLGIDLHQAQLTITVRDEAGEITHRQRVLTDFPSIDTFLAEMAERAEPVEGYLAIVEECGFTHWLVKRLESSGCAKVVVVQPLQRECHKTDRRDAAKLSEILWLNRERIRDGQRIHGLRQIAVPSEDDRQNRLLTSSRIRLARERTRLVNRIKAILRAHNLMHGCPTKGFDTKRARVWLMDLELPVADRLAVTQAVERWDMLDAQIEQLNDETARRAATIPAVQLLKTIPGAGNLTALCLVSRIGSIDRFPRPGSLANMIGLTPSVNDSGEITGRHGSITKHGHPDLRFLLGQMVAHVTKRDPRLRAIRLKIKKRRGAKTANVAIMRRLACAIWHMLKTGEAYRASAPIASRT